MSLPFWQATCNAPPGVCSWAASRMSVCGGGCRRAHLSTVTCRFLIKLEGPNLTSQLIEIMNLQLGPKHCQLCTASPRLPCRPLSGRRQVVVLAQKHAEHQQSKRGLILQSVNLGVLAAVLNVCGAPRPSNLGVQEQYGVKGLSLCPSSPNCISTSEEANQRDEHYVPPLTYNPIPGRGRKNPVGQSQAMQELREVVTSLKPGGFEPKLVDDRPDYLHLEYTSPVLGCVDDTEFWFPNRGENGKQWEVEFRSASRIGDSDFKANRKRIRDIRQALEKKGWKSTGYQ